MLTVPAVTPVTTPAAVTAARVLLLLQVPPMPVLESTVVPPKHTVVEPLIADGTVFTVSVSVARVVILHVEVADIV